MLTEPQKEQIVAATAALLKANVEGRQAAFPEELGALGSQSVAGAFVSLKRGGHLRACCGMLGQPVPLKHALEHAAWRSAVDDVRFPPVSPSEVDFLDMEVWLLGSPRVVAARGEERAKAVVIGKHGIQVVQGHASGLFLPSVAVEGKWNARRFLDQVCVKAGLPPSAWKEDATTLYTFEGEAVRGKLAGPDGPKQMSRPVCFCRAEDLPTYASFCRANIRALLTGAMPSYYLMGAADGNVSGVVLSVRAAGCPETMESQISLRPGVPLQATLNTLAQNAAQNLAAQKIAAEAVNGIQMNLLLLHDATLHGTAADPQLAGLDPKHRAILVLERNKAGLIYDPEKTAEDLLAEAVKLAQVSHPTGAAVFALDALSTSSPVRMSTAPQPVPGPAVRPAALAGSFYEADPAALGRTLDTFFAGDAAQAKTRPYPAAMVPHAGLKYSGQIAANVLRRIAIPKTVIVIGPKHTPLGMDWAVAPHQTWRIPGGAIESDAGLAQELCRAIPGLHLDAAAHQREHAIEVELPLLARLAPQAKVVGIVIGHGDLPGCLRFGKALADLLRRRDERPLLLISSDMNHFAADAENRRLDAMALEALETGDPTQLYETVAQNQISMCGVLPAVIVLETLRLLAGTPKAERVGYATTADVTGDTSRVVGYAGVLFR